MTTPPPESTYGTGFAESEAILAAQAGDMAEARRLVATMLPGERIELATACHELLHLLHPSISPYYVERIPSATSTTSTTGRP